ncbi:hypothetical protein BKA59DRAFT_461537 [Fusarium tricinctum]|uniref:Kinesin light chain n=1 Tax=Fusarium tricinctum TaxID=61284 RepID=A0A8K0WFZ2_9HYPO|nr:hypothetical protein BKA59DRAFT_461537 [Fusarium tricinctum]
MALLVTTYHRQGYYSKAESIYQAVLDLRCKVFGDKHLVTIRAMANLVLIFRDQGRWKEAEEL